MARPRKEWLVCRIEGRRVIEEIAELADRDEATRLVMTLRAEARAAGKDPYAIAMLPRGPKGEGLFPP